MQPTGCQRNKTRAPNLPKFETWHVWKAKAKSLGETREVEGEIREGEIAKAKAKYARRRNTREGEIRAKANVPNVAS